MIDTPTRYPLKDIPAEDLPLWMRQARQRIDWGVLVVFFFSLLAAWPFIIQEGLPHTNASENYVYMTSNTAEALREGRLYPRWSAPALMGYGAPLPNFQQPGAPYAAALLELLITADSVNAVRLLYILSILLTGTMTYLFVTQWGGVRAGIISSLLILYSPYVGLTAPHILGALSQSMAIALLPTLLWATNRLLQRNRPIDLLTVALVMAALILCHVRLAAVGAILSIVFGLIYTPSTNNPYHRIYLIAAIIFGAALSSFFWIPALLEANTVNWQSPVYTPREIPLRWQDFFMPLARVDLSELNPLPQFRLGMGSLLFLIFGFITALMAPKKHQTFLFFGLAGVGMATLTVIVMPQRTWMMGPITLCISIIGGAGIHLQERFHGRRKRLWLPLSVSIILAMAYPVWLAPRWPEEFGATDATAQIQYEQQGFGIASAVPGAPLSLTLPLDTQPNQSLLSSYQDGEPVRIPHNRLLPGRRISLIGANSHSDHYLANNTSPDPLQVLRANFSGWQATLDGIPLHTFTDPENGLMMIDMPSAADGHLSISLGTTTIRRASWALTWFTLALLTAISLRSLRQRRHHRPYYQIQKLLANDEARLLSILCGGFLVFIAFFVTPDSPYSLHGRPGHSLDNSAELRIRTNVGLEALSYILPDTQYTMGETLDLTLAWRASRPILSNFSVRISLEDTIQNLAWVQTELNYPGGYPTRRWEVNRFVRDVFSLDLPQTLRAGEYQIVIEILDCTVFCLPENRTFYFDQEGNSLGQRLVLPQTITIAG